MLQPELTAEQARKLAPLIAKFNRDVARQRAMDERIRKIVRDELARQGVAVAIGQRQEQRS